MKKLVILLLFAGLVMNVSSCKKKECPAPEVWGAGTWHLTDAVDANGNSLLDPNDPSSQCFKNNTELKLAEDHQGDHLQFGVMNNGTCSNASWSVIKWAEDIDSKFLIVELQTSQGVAVIDLTYESDSKLEWDMNGDGSVVLIFEK